MKVPNMDSEGFTVSRIPSFKKRTKLIMKHIKMCWLTKACFRELSNTEKDDNGVVLDQ